MEALMLVTDVTRMQQNRVCVAGYLEGDLPIRPVVPYAGLDESWLDGEDGTVIIRPWNAVKLKLFHTKPEPPHTEDVVIDEAYRRLCGTLPVKRRSAFLQRILDPSVEDIFGATIHTEPGHFVLAGEGSRSLGTVRAANIREVTYAPRNHGWDYRLAFNDASGAPYRLAVTDLSFRSFLDYLHVQEGMSTREVADFIFKCLRNSEVFLRIGLARAWVEYPEHCHLQITGVYSFPDYLDGRCFADFAMDADSSSL
jgi:hypothetical protein